nr:hypothetical protein [Thiothrix fructosivorans]
MTAGAYAIVKVVAGGDDGQSGVPIRAKLDVHTVIGGINTGDSRIQGPATGFTSAGVMVFVCIDGRMPYPTITRCAGLFTRFAFGWLGWLCARHSFWFRGWLSSGCTHPFCFGQSHRFG